jgi:hypothetical protein
MKAYLIIVWMATCNFVYQLIQTEPNYFVAAERSYFQTFAILAFMFLMAPSKSE